MRFDELNFLEETEFTEVTPKVQIIVSRFNEDRPWRDASMYMKGMETEYNIRGLKRQRSCKEILKSGFLTGCSDRAIVFRTFMLALGIPCRIVDTLEEDWVNVAFEGVIRGHVFVEFFYKDRWIVYDPSRGFTEGNDYILNRKKHVEVGKGLDFIQIYLKKGDYKDWANISHTQVLKDLVDERRVQIC